MDTRREKISRRVKLMVVRSRVIEAPIVALRMEKRKSRTKDVFIFEIV